MWRQRDEFLPRRHLTVAAITLHRDCWQYSWQYVLMTGARVTLVDAYLAAAVLVGVDLKRRVRLVVG